MSPSITRIRSRCAADGPCRISAPAHANGSRSRSCISSPPISRRAGPGWTAAALCARFATPSRLVGSVIRALQRHTLLLETEDGRLVPGRDLASIDVADVLSAVRYGQTPQDGRTSGLPAVDAVMDQVDVAIAGAVQERTLSDLVRK
jgi:hypothetical protein